jgi:hypothetical protein
MTQHANPANRRRFIKLTVAGLAAAPMAAALLSNTAAAADMVSEADAKRTDKAATCSNCSLYTGKAGAADGPCAVFPGKAVAAKGWCSSWVKKA